MLARCNRCDRTFVTDHFGRQRCPKCDGEVFVADPMQPESVEAEKAYAAPSARSEGPNDAPVFSEGEPIPWERRSELGVFKALIETMKLALTEPNAFFSRIRYAKTDGAHLYVFLVLVVPWMIVQTVYWARTPPPEQQMAELKQQLDSLKQVFGSAGLPFSDSTVQQLLDLTKQYGLEPATFGDLILELVRVPVVAFIVLYAIAGITHLTLTLLGKAKGGWSATFNAYAYACSPGPLIALPVCGWLIMTTWAVGLQIIGITKAHQTTPEWATAGVLSVHAVACCCACVPIAMLSATLGHFLHP